MEEFWSIFKELKQVPCELTVGTWCLLLTLSSRRSNQRFGIHVWHPVFVTLWPDSTDLSQKCSYGSVRTVIIYKRCSKCFLSAFLSALSDLLQKPRWHHNVHDNRSNWKIMFQNRDCLNWHLKLDLAFYVSILCLLHGKQQSSCIFPTECRSFSSEIRKRCQHV